MDRSEYILLGCNHFALRRTKSYHCEVASVKHNFVCVDMDAVIAQCLSMGFPVEATLEAHKQLGSWNTEDILEILLKSDESSAKTFSQVTIKQEDGVNNILLSESDIDLQKKQEICECSTAPQPSLGWKMEPSEPKFRVKQEFRECSTALQLSIGRKVEPSETMMSLMENVKLGKTLNSTSVMTGERSGEKNLISWKNESTYNLAGKTRDVTSSRKSSLVQRLIEMGCRPDVVEKAYEVYGMDPTYTTDDEKLDVMCDFIAAVDLNEEDDEIEGDDQEFENHEDDGGIEDWFNSQRELEDSSKTVIPYSCQSRPRLDVYPIGLSSEVRLEQNEEEYAPGGYYRYIREDDPDQEEYFYKDLEEQEGMGVFDVKKKYWKEASSPTIYKRQGVKRRPRATKSLVGLVTRRIRVPNYTKMTGFGVPGVPMIPRNLENCSADGPPYFYFENVAFMPGDDWDTISRHLYDIEPEFVNAYHFTVCKRPRGYIHNLPVEGRFEILPRAPRTIKELVPYSSAYWPSWDDRTTFNCICTNYATECTIKPVARLLECMKSDSEPPAQIRRQLMDILRMYNLVWIGPGRVTRPKVEEIEICMGFDPDHTRPIQSTNQQIKGLGNAFQVHTVGYHLSVLKNLFPGGISVLSLFSGIGGAEVALHKLGIKLNVVVCVEIDPIVRRVIEHWWQITHQTGQLITTYQDVNNLDHETLQKLMVEVGGFDLVIGGSPCSNLSAKNRFSRMGLAGKSSVAFFEYARILKEVRTFGLRHKYRKYRA
ncbi:protein MpDRMb [Marchantia polymorpha subsp. ruderalis]